MQSTPEQKPAHSDDVVIDAQYVIGWKQGIAAVVKMLEKKADDYANEYGKVDPDTGAMEFGEGSRALAKLEYWSELSELAEEVRSMLAVHAATPEASKS